MEHLRRTLWFAARFTIEVVVGTALFCVVYLAAFGLSLFAGYLKEQGADAILIYPMYGVKYVLVVGDSVVLLVGTFGSCGTESGS